MVEDWIKMGYSDEEAEKLNELSKVGSRMADISIDEMTWAMQSLMEQLKEEQIPFDWNGVKG